MSMRDLAHTDYLRIKWRLLFLALSCATVAGSFLLLKQLDEDAQRALRIARTDLDAAQEAVDKIEEEEATIIEYIGRYNELAAARVVGNEDRLQLIESVAQLRAQYDLFPVQMNIGGQQAFTLQYAPGVRQPGRPVLLNQSTVDISLPLLHENDLLRLLDAMLDRPNLLQVRECALRANGRNTGNYIRLGQHFQGSCTLQWTTFVVQEDGEAPL